MSMVSIVILSIIGISFLIGIILIILIQLELDNQKMEWIEIQHNGYPTFKGYPKWYAEQIKINNTNVISNPEYSIVDYLRTKGLVVYDYKIEYRQEVAEMCEALSCRTGYVSSYLISKKDIPEFVKLRGED